MKGFSGTALGLSQIGTLELLFTAFVSSRVNNAIAEELKLQEFVNYIHFSFRGGPPRWQWDIPLTPHGEFEGFTPNPFCINKLDKNETEGQTFKYATTVHNKLHVPYLWKTKIPASNGGKANMSSLLDNTIMFRGLNNTADGHSQNRIKMNQPIPGGFSLTGLAADKGSSPIPAVHYGSAHGFKSMTGLNSVPTSGNLFTSLLDALRFQYTSNRQIDGLAFGGMAKAEASKRLDNMIALLGSSKRGLASAPYNDLKNAKELFLRDFGDLTAMYNAFRNRYTLLIQRAFAEHDLAGFDNVPLESLNNKHYQLSINQGTLMSQGRDLRDLLVGADGKTLGIESITTPSNQYATKINNMAESFALAEFCLQNNLATSMMLPMDAMTRLYFPSFKNGTETYVKNATSNHDSHWTGSVLSMFLFGKYFKALSSCVFELRGKLENQRLASGSKWEKTLFHFSAEFPRRPDTKGFQNGHAWNGNCITLMGGMIKKFQIVGNCKKDGSKGHYGVSAKMKALGDRHLLVGNIASSVSTILGTPSPTPNDETLVGQKNNQIVSFAGDPEDEA